MSAEMRLPHHVAIIMDGNGRWAKSRGLPRLEGHRRGAAVARDVVKWARELGVRQISLFAFSTENWERPSAEVQGLMSLLASMLGSQLKDMKQSSVRLRAIGDLQSLPAKVRNKLEKACTETRDGSAIDMVLCLNYGGRQEILDGVKQLVRKLQPLPDFEKQLDAIDVESFREQLWCHDLAPVDLLIRTGGEQRISNFYLWDAAYAELYFSERYWPDFSRDDLAEAVKEYGRRERRFGLTSEQL